MGPNGITSSHRRHTTNTRHLRPEDLRGKRWRGLIRESTERQAEQFSPDRQRADLIRAAEELGLTGDGQFYVRVGSGEAEQVPELEQALADGRRGEYDVLLVIHTSRFARNRAEAVTMKREFRKAGLVIYFVSQRLISGTFAGGLAEGINEVIDEHANEERRFWIAGGLRERQVAGLWVGRIPFGYRKHMTDRPDGSRSWDGTLEVDPEAGPIVREMFEMRARGSAWRDIAMSMNRRGVSTALGAPWGSESVQRLLSNPVYIGQHHRYRRHDEGHYYSEEDDHDGRRVVGESVPAIVEPSLFHGVQALSPGGSTMADKRQYPLSAVLRCGQCGSAYIGVFSGWSRYYRCYARARGAGACNGPSIRADEAEAAFSDWLARFRLPLDWREAIARTRSRHEEDKTEAKRAAMERRLERLRELYLMGEVEIADYRTEAGAIREEMGKFDKADTGNLTDNVVEALTHVGAGWRDETAPKDARRALPRLLLRSAKVETADLLTLEVRTELRPLLEVCHVRGDARLEIRSRTHMAYRVVFSG